LLGGARAIDDFESVVVKAGVHFYVRDRVLHGQDFADVGQRLERVERVVAYALAQDFFFGFVRGVAHLDAHQETIELRFG